MEGSEGILAGDDTNTDGVDTGERSPMEVFVEGEESEVIREADFGVWVKGSGFLVD